MPTKNLLTPALLGTAASRLVLPSAPCLALAPIPLPPPGRPPALQLLSAGRLVFQGPVELLQPFFERTLGFLCPMSKGVAEVVQELATAAGGRAAWRAHALRRLFAWARGALICDRRLAPQLTAIARKPAPKSPSAGQERYWDCLRGPFRFLPAADIAQAFYGSTAAGKAVQRELAAPYSWGGGDAAALPTRR